MRRQIIDYYGTRSSIGQGPYLPRGISSSMRRQNIDYSGTQSSDGTRSLSPKRNFFVHEVKNYRLLRYSSFGRDKLPISQKDSHIRDNNQSTTTVLDSIRDKISTSQEELLIHEMTTSRLLRTRPKKTAIKEVITQEDEDLSITGQRGFIRPRDNQKHRLP